MVLVESSYDKELKKETFEGKIQHLQWVLIIRCSKVPAPPPPTNVLTSNKLSTELSCGMIQFGVNPPLIQVDTQINVS